MTATQLPKKKFPELSLLTDIFGGGFTSVGKYRTIRWGSFFKMACANRVLYSVARTLSPRTDALGMTESEKELLGRIEQKGASLIRQTGLTIQFATDLFEQLGVDYRIIKTDRGYPYVVNDIDILVHKRDYPAIYQRLGALEHEAGPERAGLQMHYKFRGLSQIDLHTSTTDAPAWPQQSCVLINGTQYVESCFVWDGAERGIWEDGIEFSKPSITAEACIMMVNTLFGHFYLPLIDILFYRDNTPSIDFQAIYRQACKFRWAGAFGVFLSLLQNVFTAFFPEDSLLAPLKPFLPDRAVSRHPARLPLLFSYTDMMRIFLEKHPFFTKVDIFNFFYFPFTKVRYLVTGGTRTPITGPWFDFSS